MRFVKFLVLLILFFCGVVFFIQNSIFITDKIALKFSLFGNQWSTNPIPLYLYLLSAFLLGAILTFLYLVSEKLRLSREVRKYRSQVQKLEEELASYRGIEGEQEQSQEEIEEKTS